MKTSFKPSKNGVAPLREVIFDLGCHGYNHVSADKLYYADYEIEIKQAFEFLRFTFPEEKVLTYAAPYNTVTQEFLKYLDDYAIACRIGSSGEQANLSSDFDMYRIKSFTLSESTDYSALQEVIDILVNKGDWIVQLLHTVTAGEPYESVGTSKSTLDAHCKALYEKYNGRVWFASFQDVAIYATQLKNTVITPTEFTQNTMSFTVTCSLDKEVYNSPVTIKLYVPSKASTVTLSVNGEVQNTTVESDENGCFVLANVACVWDSLITVRCE